MPQALSGTAKLRAPFAATAGPPNGPSALRVSTMRHGVMGVKCIGLEITGGDGAVIVRFTMMSCGLLVAPGDVTTITPIFGPAGRPDGSMAIVRVVAVGVRT